MEDIIFESGEFSYMRVGGKGYIKRGIVNAEFKTFDPKKPNLRWIQEHKWDKEVIEFARTIKLLGLEGEVNDE